MAESGPPPTRSGRRLEGKACLIVGGTGGIGLATAARFLDEGAHVVVSGLDETTVADAQTQLDRQGLAGAFIADVSDPASVDRLVATAVERLGGRLDTLVHVAGISGRRFGDGPLDACTDEGWKTVMEVNAFGVFLTNRAAIRQMQTQEPDKTGMRGSVLNVGSVLADSPSPELFGTIAYAASKGAIRSLTRAAAAYYAPEGIRFNLIEPGLIETPMAARALDDPAIMAYLATKQPLVGGPGAAEDVAEAALFLSEPTARFLTGVVLNVDGGWCVSEGQRLVEDRS